MLKKYNDYLYYVLIGILSLAMVAFLPMVGTTAGLALTLPNTWAGWLVWLVSKSASAVLNILIFRCFIGQGETNVKDHPKYLEAKAILYKYTDLYAAPRGPIAWLNEQMKKKGTSIFIFTLVSTFALTQAVLTFDIVAMISYIFTAAMGLVFGVIQMKNTEDYYTDEFWRYAKQIQREREGCEYNPLTERSPKEIEAEIAAQKEECYQCHKYREIVEALKNKPLIETHHNCALFEQGETNDTNQQ
jgi:hypothetical protein